MIRDTIEKFSPTTIALHWIVAAFMILLLASGQFMAEFEVYSLYDWHKSFGITLVIFAVWRIVWRIQNGWPVHVQQYDRLTEIAAKVVHYVLIIGTVLMPISGFLMSGFGGHGVAWFGLELMAPNPDPMNPQKVLPINETLAGLGHEVHEIGGTLLWIALALHVAGALKHHIMDKDGTLRRMRGERVEVKR